MSPSTNRKPSAQKRALYCHCRLRALVCNVNTPRNKGTKFFGCANFKEWVEDNDDDTDSSGKEQGCTIDEIMIQNKMLLIENRRLRLENNELNIDEMQRN
ncbi:hypothetical protein Gotri_004327 [Gossypium trilobum]|uniref:Uncharacterized protein n=2 Tax=Gossypium TaxID=3633 RepID=A0A7J9F4T8_9ROSI|nr:hypothetical protein [Gossypium trilobum]